MYETLSKRITSFFIQKGMIPQEKQEIYEYSYEVLLSECAYTLLMLAIALISKTLIPSLCFFLGFLICRKVAGGYHASTYTKCHLLFIANQILFILLVYFVPPPTRWLFTLGMLLAALPLIYTLAPMDHPNKPFDRREYQKYKKQSRILVFLLVIISGIVLSINKNTYIYFCFSFGIFSASVSLLLSFIERSGKKHEKNQKLYG